MKDFIKLIEENIQVEKTLRQQYESWKPETVWEDNPKPREELLPGEYICRIVENNIPCRWCGEVCYIHPAKLCKDFKEIVYPTCSYCNEEKTRCKCALGALHKQLKYL